MSDETAAAWTERVEVVSRQAQEEHWKAEEERNRQHTRYRLTAIAKRGECKCGFPPYVDGNPCSRCLAREALEGVEEA